MDGELQPIAGTALIILITALGEYFGPTGARALCELLKTTGSWILGSFALMAVSKTVSWEAGDIDIFLDQGARIGLTRSIIMLAEFLIRKGFRFFQKRSGSGLCDNDKRETLTFKRKSQSRAGRTIRHKVQLIIEKNNADQSFPLRVLRLFDLSCCCCGFNGEHLYQASWNILPMFFTQNKNVRSYRIKKYQDRGYMFLNDYGPEAIDSLDDFDIKEEDDNELSNQAALVAQPVEHTPSPVRAQLSSLEEAPALPLPSTCQTVIKRTKVPCGRQLFDGRCRYHK